LAWQKTTTASVTCVLMIPTLPKPIYENKLFFKFKRIASQFRMLVRQLNFISQSDRRKITLIKKDFYVT
jgi:hypothetical protein